MNAMKLGKAALGIAILIILFAMVMNWWGDYRAATGKSNRSTTTTSTVTSQGSSSGGSTPAKTPAVSASSPQILVVAVDGLNFRPRADAQAKAIRGLSKGERITVIATEGDWYRVEDSKGVIGYITSNPTYTNEVN